MERTDYSRAMGSRPGMAVRPGLVLWLWAAVWLLGSGCASNNHHTAIRNQISIPFNEVQKEQLSTSRDLPYLLQRGDVFSIISLTDKELNQISVIVLPDGTSSFVGLGTRMVANMSVNEVVEMLTAEYSKIFRDVKLNLSMELVSDSFIYVLGEVKRPGMYGISRKGGGMMSAIAKAGGMTDWSDKASVMLLRITDDSYVCREIDMASLMNGEKFDIAAVDLRPHDVVYVTRSGIGDFTSFSRNVVASMGSYTRIILDARLIKDPYTIAR